MPAWHRGKGRPRSSHSQIRWVRGVYIIRWRLGRPRTRKAARENRNRRSAQRWILIKRKVERDREAERHEQSEGDAPGWKENATRGGQPPPLLGIMRREEPGRRERRSVSSGSSHGKKWHVERWRRTSSTRATEWKVGERREESNESKMTARGRK